MKIILVAAALLLASTAGAQVYKWVDEKGRTHYEERPPEGKDATKLNVPPPSPSKDAPQKESARDLKEQEQGFRQRQIERQQKETAEEQKRVQREKACAQAVRDLDFQSRRGRFYTRDEKGEKNYRTDGEQAAVLAAAQKRVEELCR
jgi:hypothetical protein